MYDYVSQSYSLHMITSDSVKANYAAESALEMALLRIQEKGYGYSARIDHDLNNTSILLSNTPNSIEDFRSGEVFFSYDISVKSNSYTGTLERLESVLIPLFYLDSFGQEKKITDLNFKILWGDTNMLSWWIIWTHLWISGTWNLQDKQWEIQDFLSQSSSNYLLLSYQSPYDIFSYTLHTTKEGEFFSKPFTEIIARGQSGEYYKVMKTKFDYTEFVWEIKYALFGL